MPFLFDCHVKQTALTIDQHSLTLQCVSKRQCDERLGGKTSDAAVKSNLTNLRADKLNSRCLMEGMNNAKTTGPSLSDAMALNHKTQSKAKIKLCEWQTKSRHTHERIKWKKSATDKIRWTIMMTLSHRYGVSGDSKSLNPDTTQCGKWEWNANRPP